MAYVVAEQLHMRPYTVLTTWGCEELLVSFGVYMNERMAESYNDFQQLDSKQKSQVKNKPTEYALRFVTFEQIDELAKPKSEDQQQEEREMELKMEALLKGGGRINGR